LSYGIVSGQDAIEKKPAKTAVAEPKKFSISGGKRHPDLDVDLGVRCRRQRGRDPAKAWQARKHLPAWRSVGPGRYRLSGLNVVSGNVKLAKLAHVAAAPGVALMPRNKTSSAEESALPAPPKPLARAEVRCLTRRLQ
jgi:hypothetical protein